MPGICLSNSVASIIERGRLFPEALLLLYHLKRSNYELASLHAAVYF